MNIANKITQVVIHIYEWASNLDPHKVANEVTWYCGIQVHFALLHMNKIIDFAWDVFTVIFIPLVVWLILFFFKIWVKYLVAKYLPGLKKYFHHKDESDD